MIFGIIISLVVIYVVFIKVAGKKLEDKAVNQFGGIAAMYGEYFGYLRETFPSLKIDNESGSKITYRVRVPDTNIQFSLKTVYIKGIIFTTYEMYASNSGNLKLLHKSPR